MAEILKKFGRYFLLDQIAQGGMAEIYRARMAALDGAGRLIVIKRIQAGFGSNAEFLAMFRSEIKVMMGFNHPNIVQLYDFGEENNQPYISMELVDGKNLRQFLNRYTEQRSNFPIDLATFIIEQSACGLHYAHSFRDKISGEALNIIHRDVSPQNILISFDGNVKIIDFGIAKATVNGEATRAGVIKGKPSYLAPEQITGETLDRRCDIFSLGAVLWELLAGRKLFAGDNDLAVLKMIESCNSHVKPPSSYNPEVPPELDKIVLKALSKERNHRYQTAEEMQRALHRFLYSYNSDFNPSDLSYQAKDLFKKEIVRDRKQIQKLNEKVEQLLKVSEDSAEADAAKSFAAGGSAGVKKEDTTTQVELSSSSSSKAAALYPPFHKARQQLAGGAPTANQSRGREPSRRVLEYNSDEFAGVEIEKGVSKKTTPVEPQSRSISRVSSSGSQRSRKSGHPLKWLIWPAAALAAVAFYGPEFGVELPFLSQFKAKMVSTQTTSVHLEGDSGEIQSLSVNGQRITQSLPATLKEVQPGQKLLIEAVAKSGARFSEELIVKKGQQHNLQIKFPTRTPTQAVDPSAVSVKLKLSPGGSPQEFDIRLNGSPVEVVGGTLNLKVDVPYELIVNRRGFRTYRKDFVLKSAEYKTRRHAEFEIRLDPNPAGYFTLRTTPSAEATIIRNGVVWEVVQTPLIDHRMAVGEYTIRLENKTLGMEKEFSVQVEGNKTFSRNVRLEIRDPQNARIPSSKSP